MRRYVKTTANFKKLLDLKLKGKRPRWRSRTYLLKCMHNTLKERGMNLKEVEDRRIHLKIIARLQFPIGLDVLAGVW